MFIKLSHDGFPEITHFPDSVLNPEVLELCFVFGKRERIS